MTWSFCKGLEPATFWLTALQLVMTLHHPSYVFANMSQNPNMAEKHLIEFTNIN